MNTKRENTREYILACAYNLFAKDGFNKITMKDVCVATGLSRGGLYSHFGGTSEIFEAILEKFNQKNLNSFKNDFERGESAVKILDRTLNILEQEMYEADKSLALAMYEYSASVKDNILSTMNKVGEEKWRALIEYGINRGEFNNVCITEVINMVLYAYQGVRMWSRIVDITPEVCHSITSNIRRQLVKE